MAPQQKEEQFPPEIMNKPKTHCRFNCPVSRSSTILRDLNYYLAGKEWHSENYRE